MPNFPAVFTTKRNGPYGSSLYLVTQDWVLRCSGNTNGREATTFGRRRAIFYTKPGATFAFPALELTPQEGGHTGNFITAVLSDTAAIPPTAPANWVHINGVSWQTAIDEIQAARAATSTPVAMLGRFCREVGHLIFLPE